MKGTQKLKLDNKPTNPITFLWASGFFDANRTENSDYDWTSYSLLLSETGGWQLSGAAPTQAQVLQVLADVTDLQIRGEFITGSDVGTLDNVNMVPEPATIVMLGLGGMILQRKREHSQKDRLG